MANGGAQGSVGASGRERARTKEKGTAVVSGKKSADMGKRGGQEWTGGFMRRKRGPFDPILVAKEGFRLTRPASNGANSDPILQESSGAPGCVILLEATEL